MAEKKKAVEHGPEYVLSDEGVKIRKIEPYSRYWEHLADNQAREMIDMVPCKHCGGPRPSSYKCERCGYE